MPLWPRISIRILMAAVLLIAVILGLTIPAVEVYRAKEQHVHIGIDVSETPTLASSAGIEPPFWSRYLRRINWTTVAETALQTSGRDMKLIVASSPTPRWRSRLGIESLTNSIPIRQTGSKRF